MNWEDATQLAERIAKSPDAGTLHVAVIYNVPRNLDSELG